jgi:hypothetical protein
MPEPLLLGTNKNPIRIRTPYERKSWHIVETVQGAYPQDHIDHRTYRGVARRRAATVPSQREPETIHGRMGRQAQAQAQAQCDYTGFCLRISIRGSNYPQKSLESCFNSIYRYRRSRQSVLLAKTSSLNPALQSPPSNLPICRGLLRRM